MDFNDDLYEKEHTEKIVSKYKLLRSKIIKHYYRAIKYIKISKIFAATLFVLFTIVAADIGINRGSKMFWVALWICAIFLNVFIFWIVDYIMFLVKDKVIPYLEDDNQVEFGEYDIFIEDDDDDEEEEVEEDEYQKYLDNKAKLKKEKKQAEKKAKKEIKEKYKKEVKANENDFKNIR